MQRDPLRTWPGRLLLVVLAASLALACSKKESRYPTDAVRYKRITDAMDALRKSYAEKDASGLHALLLPSNRADRVENGALDDFQHYREITLDWTMERIVIDGERIDVFIHWQGTWKKDDDSPLQRERGHGVLRWIGEHSILLRDTEGDLPFGMAKRATEKETAPAGQPAGPAK